MSRFELCSCAAAHRYPAYREPVPPSFGLLIVCLLFGGCHNTSAIPAKKESAIVNKRQLDLFKISDQVFDRYSKLGYDKLTQPEKVFICVWGLDGEVNNGGFDQYYFNSSGDHALDVVASLKAIDARRTANLLRQANALFGKAGPPPNCFARQRQLDELGDAKKKTMKEIEEIFFKDEDKLEQLLEAYICKHADDFRLK